MSACVCLCLRLHPVTFHLGYRAAGKRGIAKCLVSGEDYATDVRVCFLLLVCVQDAIICHLAKRGMISVSLLLSRERKLLHLKLTSPGQALV